ncbi:MAG: hypothetical protein HZC47_03670 [Methanobacterium sp.]|uniref:hypothetical protein n=1 Tax=Methanobacterium sp. TaxID=2164 RepID=UPI003D64E010|nr:hypothetical protein [Methanobacterium sp.]
MSIELGSKIFDGPHLLKEWNPLTFPAIYAVLMRPEPKDKPDEYFILYLCMSEEFSKLESCLDHPKYKCWFKEAGFRSNIYISAHLMPNSTPDEREKLINAFIKIYKPVCND